MRKNWKEPMLQILDIKMTLNGPGNANPDCFDVSDGRSETHEGQSNASCKPNSTPGSELGS